MQLENKVAAVTGSSRDRQGYRARLSREKEPL